MERCPNCRARCKESNRETCRRCGMQLTELWRLEENVAWLDQAAATIMLAGDMQQAHTLLKRRLRLKQDDFIQRLLAFAAEQADTQQVYNFPSNGHVKITPRSIEVCDFNSNMQPLQ